MIDKENFEKASFEKNQKFIKEILRLATHNAFTKDDLLFLIRWQNAIIEKMKICYNCESYIDDDAYDVCKTCYKYSKWELADENN